MAATLARIPEGDTIFRTAATLRQWIGGLEITAARSRTRVRVPVERLVGHVIDRVESRAKHVLVRAGPVTLHTHMKMTGSWHVYSRGDAWERPERQARAVIECGDRLAVCFNAPVVEVLERDAEHLHPALARLGPDVMQPPIDVIDVQRRIAAQPRDRPIADVLLDQSVIGGIGNIWRAETLFAEKLHPTVPAGDLTPDRVAALVTTAARLMTGPRRPQSVYRRTGRPCPNCATAIASGRFENGRFVYWCPRCQSPDRYRSPV